MNSFTQIIQVFRDRGLRVFDLGVEGLGVEFRDGADVWWLLPGDPLSSVTVAQDEQLDAQAMAEAFELLDALRSQAIHAIRHHLARQRFRTWRSVCGHWSIQTETGSISSSLEVGSWLTAELARTRDVTATFRAVFTGSLLRRPTKGAVKRALERPDLPEEMPWLDKPREYVLDGDRLADVLRMMGICHAIEHVADVAEAEGRVVTSEEMVEAAMPTGRIGRALLRLGEALPEAKTSFDLGSNAIDLKFRDGLGSFSIDPRSRTLAARVRAAGPDAAGEALAAEFRRLEADRARVIFALRTGLPRLGYRMQDEGRWLHFGREWREASLDLDAILTEALRSSSPEAALRSLLGERSELAEGLIADLPAASPDILPGPTGRELRPAPPAAISLPPIGAEEARRFDRTARKVLDDWLADRRVVEAYFDPLAYDPARDTWASSNDWLAAARNLTGGEYPNPTAELIRLERGDLMIDEACVKKWTSADTEGVNNSAEVVTAYRARREHPELVTAWLLPMDRYTPSDTDMAALAREGDWIAARRLAARVGVDDEDPSWEVLAALRPEAAEVFLGADRLRNWRAQAVAEIAGQWCWEYGVSDDLLRAAVMHGWRELGPTMAGNPYLAHALRPDDNAAWPWPYGVSTLLQAWSRLDPSEHLRRLVASLFRNPPRGRIERLAWRIVGAEGPKWADTAAKVVEELTTELLRGLAVAWVRCRAAREGDAS